jgi:hypothetical protein
MDVDGGSLNRMLLSDACEHPSCAFTIRKRHVSDGFGDSCGRRAMRIRKVSTRLTTCVGSVEVVVTTVQTTGLRSIVSSPGTSWNR